MNKSNIFLVLFIGILLAICFNIKNRTPKAIVTCDTITVTDTFVKPVSVTERVIRKDTILISNDNDSSGFVLIRDTITNTIKAEVPITQTTYEDSTYKAVISGYHTSLDSMFVKHKTITITEKIKPSRFGLGVSVGYDPLNNRPAILIGGHITLYNFK